MKKRHLYQVILKKHHRWDVDEQWEITETVIFQTDKKEKLLKYFETHLYLDTEMEPDDDGSHWCNYQEIYWVKVR